MADAGSIRRRRKKTPLTAQEQVRRTQTIDVMVALIPVVLMAFYYYGLRSLVLCAYAIIFSVGCDYLSLRLLGQKKWERFDFSCVITPVIFVLMLPASAPYWIALVGVFLAVFVAKLPFGGAGKNIFNPAAVAYAILGISWPEQMFRYPVPFVPTGLEWAPQGSWTTGIAYQLQIGGAPTVQVMDRLLGNFAGPMGTTCTLVLIACGIYLVVRRTVSWQTVFCALGSAATISYLFPRILVSRLSAVSFEMIAGVFLFGVFFMAIDPVTSPRTGWGQALYGILLGTSTMMIRYFGKMEVAFPYALLFCNAVAHKCDEYANRAVSFVKRGALLVLKREPAVEAGKGE